MWHTRWHRGWSCTLVMAYNIFKWVFNYIHWTWSDQGDKWTFMFMPIEERQRATNQNMLNVYLQRNKMDWVRQWMSPGILLIKTILQREKKEGETKTDTERESIVKNQEQQKPDSEISLWETGHIERINRETRGKCSREHRGSNLVNTVAWPWPAADTSDHL